MAIDATCGEGKWSQNLGRYPKTLNGVYCSYSALPIVVMYCHTASRAEQESGDLTLGSSVFPSLPNFLKHSRNALDPPPHGKVLCHAGKTKDCTETPKWLVKGFPHGKTVWKYTVYLYLQFGEESSLVCTRRRIGVLYLEHSRLWTMDLLEMPKEEEGPEKKTVLPSPYLGRYYLLWNPSSCLLLITTFVPT
jgi:hypothetical protein